MEKILNSRLAVITGWGTGCAILFAWFGKGLQSGSPWLAFFDITLATCAVTFFVLVTVAVTKGVAQSDIDSTQPVEISNVRALLGSLFSLLLLFAGWSLLLISSEPATTRSATTLGALLSGGGLLFTYKWIAKLMNREWS